ncbi:hypothetical protein QZH41_010756, partial [Actinostola sp. cb2023]
FPIQGFKRILDKRVWFHKACALTTIVASVIHTTAHLTNAKRFSVNYSQEYPELNFAEYKDQVSCFIYASSKFLRCVSFRNSSYEVFWYAHHLFVVFYILLAIHGLGGVVKHQTNLDKHIPGCTNKDDVNMTSLNTSDACVEPAEFEADETQTWKFLIFPLCLYLLDRMVRVLRNFQEVKVLKVVKHPCDVVELKIKLTRFEAQPGQYVFIRCPDVARFEWHPFTLTRCPTPDDDGFSIHFKISGDWTIIFFRIKVDGPYGSPCMDVREYEVSLCIATGIGVTPFAAVINSLRMQELSKPIHYNTRLRRLYFIWVGRNVRSFGWFVDMLYSKHLELWKKNWPDFLVCRFYLTRNQRQSSYKTSNREGCAASWLDARLTQGRPDWQSIFRRVAQENPRSIIGVFYCGTRSVTSRLRNLCNKPNKTRSTFVFHKENL